MDSDDQNSGVMMECMTGDNDATKRFYGRVEEIWELDYSRLHNTTMFRVRWATTSEGSSSAFYLNRYS